MNTVKKTVSEFIVDNLHDVMLDIRRERKRAALQDNRQSLRNLPPLSQEVIATFAEQVQEKCPSLEPNDLGHVVEILANLERARSGYSLLEKLSTLKSEEYDQLDSILENWSISDVKKVLGELRYRLDLIDQLEQLVDRATTDELHDLQPVFERGLWMFGPEFESVSFLSNRSLATVVEEFFGGAALTTPRKATRFRCAARLVDWCLRVRLLRREARSQWNRESRNSRAEARGFELSYDEKDQAMKYARQLRKSGKVGPHIPIVCHVLGSRVNIEAAAVTNEGETSVIPRSYTALLRGAHARTFNLLKSIKSVEMWRSSDEDLNAVLENDRLPLFES